MRRAAYLLIALVGFAAATDRHTQGEEAESAVADTWVPAKPIERAPPRYPAEALSERQDGWVMLSYVISATGEVIEPMVEDSSGVEPLERAALRAIRGWRFEPAKRNGQPVEQSMAKSVLRFQLDGTASGSHDFEREFRRISELMRTGDLPAAKSLLDDLEFGGRSNLYEDAWFWWLKYVYLEHAKSPDVNDKIIALRRAVGYEEDYLEPAMFVVAAQNLFSLEVESRDLSAALRTHARLRDSKTAKRADRYKSALAILTPIVERIEEIVAGDSVLVVGAEIGDNAYWVHDLLRRSFSVREIMGRVDVVDVRCSQGTKRYYSFPLNATWRVPESWGGCGVYIKGETGTRFIFEEYPATATATPIED